MADVRDEWAAAVIADPDIPATYLRTAWALREHADREGHVMVGIERLARDTGYGRRTIERQLARLVGDGIIDRQPGRGVMAAGGITTLTALRAPPRYRSLAAGTFAPSGTGRSSTEVPVAEGRGTGRQRPDVPSLHKKPPPRVRARDGVARDAREPKEPAGPEVVDTTAKMLEDWLARGWRDDVILASGQITPERLARARASRARK